MAVKATKKTRAKSTKKNKKSTPKPSFETVWAALQETDRLIKETRESQKETDRLQKKNERSIDRLSEQMGDMSNKFGKIAEHLVAPGIVEKFNSLGYHFDGISDQGYKIFEGKGIVKAEIDILLENGNFIIAVEVKTDVKEKDIKHHVRRIEILREYRDRFNDPRKIRGAIAGAIFSANTKKLAIEEGFYVLEQSGDTMKMDIPKDFKPKEW